MIHPDDLAYVLEAEGWCVETMKMIGMEHQLYLKSGYCFRLQVSAERYELFHHQAVHIAKDREDKLRSALNIHCKIHHISTQNNYVATVTGIGNRDDFHQKSFKVVRRADRVEERLTKRELEVLVLLTRSYSDKEITQILNISYHTVRTHHKNILKKTQSKNSFELLKRSLENVYL